ncbi:hypothetical protein B9N43_11515 [Denitratisoma sp. DHT3]|uniref:YggT family protein n=1 Tax=Denitratisoma sp. DHT3 TaxID=1981880 RepID=UPI00119877D0|nr:YggT family protein [Denitratisoma sp. DHT3]QDX81822.1 hypothetical protein B9N43_11515 [Denitratisoma sp. DHT3]
MLIRLFLMVLDVLAGFLSLALLARFALQWARAPYRNPIAQFLVAVTDWAVRPARRVIPSAWGLDLASLVLAWLAQGLYLGLAHGLGGLGGGPLEAVGLVALLALLETLKLAAWLAQGVIIVAALLSWINPYAPMAPVVNALAQPLLRPFQRLIPPIGGVDLSPLAALLAIQLLLAVLTSLFGALLMPMR